MCEEGIKAEEPGRAAAALHLYRDSMQKLGKDDGEDCEIMEDDDCVLVKVELGM